MPSHGTCTQDHHRTFAVRLRQGRCTQAKAPWPCSLVRKSCDTLEVQASRLWLAVVPSRVELEDRLARAEGQAGKAFRVRICAEFLQELHRLWDCPTVEDNTLFPHFLGG